MQAGAGPLARCIGSGMLTWARFDSDGCVTTLPDARSPPLPFPLQLIDGIVLFQTVEATVRTALLRAMRPTFHVRGCFPVWLPTLTRQGRDLSLKSPSPLPKLPHLLVRSSGKAVAVALPPTHPPPLACAATFDADALFPRWPTTWWSKKAPSAERCSSL